MKRWMRWAALLYPASWRARYLTEFQGLLEDVELRWADLWDILRGALGMQMKTWTFWKVAGGFGLAGLTVAAVTALRAPNEYMSQAVMRVTPSGADASQGKSVVQAQLLLLEQKALSQESLTKMIDQGKLYENERQNKSVVELVQQMRDRDIRIRLLHQNAGRFGTAFTVAFRQNDQAKAQWGTKALLTRLMEENLSASQATRAGDRVTLEVLDPADLPQKPFKPNRPVWVGFGLVAGLAAGGIVFGIGKWPSRRLQGS